MRLPRGYLYFLPTLVGKNKSFVWSGFYVAPYHVKLVTFQTLYSLLTVFIGCYTLINLFIRLLFGFDCTFRQAAMPFISCLSTLINFSPS
jgi:hypothetical protein